MLILKDLTFKRKDLIVFKNINGQANAGELIILVGDNGSGKTTLFNNIAGILTPTSGEILLEGLAKSKDVNALLDRLSYVMDDGGTIPLLTVREQLYLQSQLEGEGTSNLSEKIEKIIKLFNLTVHENFRAEELSAGLRKKLGLAIGLNKNAELFLFDEPFNSLDIQSAAVLVQIFEVLKTKEKTIIVSTHELSLLSHLCDKIWEIKNGSMTSISDRSRIDDLIAKKTNSSGLDGVSALPWN